jgi:hypothetical protein
MRSTRTSGSLEGNVQQWKDVTFIGVYHDDPDRVEKLLTTVSPWFERMVLGVQTNDPANDPTLKVCQSFADEVIVDVVHGFAEPTISKVINRTNTLWCFLISADEMPDQTLLENIGNMMYMSRADDYVTIDGWWIRFLSSIDGIEYPSEQDNHLRMFHRTLNWPTSLHSRPHAQNAAFWHPSKGTIRHDRSLDEMMLDYLNYWAYGVRMNNAGWTVHNRQMMHDACTATAQNKGWEEVTKYEWWEKIRQIAFKDCEKAGVCRIPDWYKCR